MNKKFKFTNTKIQKLPPNNPNSKSTEAEYTDDADVSGLKLLVSKIGSKRYLLRYTFHSRKRSILLGKAGNITVRKARELAKSHHAKIAEGTDPQEEKKIHLTQPTVSEFFWNTYLHIIKAKKLSWKKDVQRFTDFIEPRIGDIRYPDLKPLDVLHLQQYIADPQRIKRVYAPATCNRVIAVLKTMTSIGVNLGILESNVATPISLLKEDNIRERFFDIEQTKKIINAALSFPNFFVGAAIAMLYITGNRKNEIFTLEWRNFDYSKRTVLVEKSKNGKPITIHLSELAFSIISNLERIEGNPYIFVGRFEGTHIKEVRDAYHKILTEAGVTDFNGICFHTARHSVASIMAGEGFSQIQIMQKLAHKSVLSSNRYVKFSDESARSISQGYCDLLASD